MRLCRHRKIHYAVSGNGWQAIWSGLARVQNTNCGEVLDVGVDAPDTSGIMCLTPDRRSSLAAAPRQDKETALRSHHVHNPRPQAVRGPALPSCYPLVEPPHVVQ